MLYRYTKVSPLVPNCTSLARERGHGYARFPVLTYGLSNRYSRESLHLRHVGVPMWSRRRVLQVGSLSALNGLSGCTALPFVGTIGFRLRNYTEESHDARVEIQFYGQTAFEQTYQLPTASEDDPYVQTETVAVSNVPTGVTYTVSLFLEGTEVRTIDATRDCTSHKDETDEELDINIGFGPGDEVMIEDTQC